MAIPTLHFDVITDILSRLPSKSLLRFKSVSKQWFSLIVSPNFINLHLTQTLISDNSSHNLIVSRTQLSLFSSPVPDNRTNPNSHFSELDHPLKQISQYSQEVSLIFGSINGVVCISSYDRSFYAIFLYNPSTKTHRLVPPFTPFANTDSLFKLTHGSTDRVAFGLGFDSVSDDYKVVRLGEKYTNHVLVYREASVYSLRNDSWKCVNDQTKMGRYNLQLGTSRGVCVNEGLHFIASNTMSDYIGKVKCFNLQTEKFSIFELPKLDERFSNVNCVIKELGGCFSVLVNYVNPNLLRRELVRVDLWVMKEHGNIESWFRLFSICDLAMFPFRSHWTQVVFSKDKERVLLQLDRSALGWYSWSSNTFERITIHGLPNANAIFDSWTYVDSLVPLSKIKDKDNDNSH